MKRNIYLSIFLSFMLLLGIAGIAMATATDSGKIVYQATEITDEKVLQERMDKRITDNASIQVKVMVDGDVFTDDSGCKWKIVASDVKYTAQKLKEVVHGENRQQDFVVNSSVEAVVVPLAYGDNLPIHDYDGGSHALARLDQTTYMSFEDGIDAGEATNGTATKFHSTRAKITRNDSGSSLVSLQIGQNGYGLSSTTKTGPYSIRPQVQDVSRISGPGDGTYYSISANKTNYWWWIKKGVVQSGGVNSFADATLTRGTQTFTFATRIDG